MLFNPLKGKRRNFKQHQTAHDVTNENPSRITFTVWRFPQMGIPPKHKNLHHFSLETHGLGDPPFEETPCCQFDLVFTGSASALSPVLPSNFGPIRESVPMARATSFTSAPVRSHNLRFTAWDWKTLEVLTGPIEVILKFQIHDAPRYVAHICIMLVCAQHVSSHSMNFC